MKLSDTGDNKSILGSFEFSSLSRRFVSLHFAAQTSKSYKDLSPFDSAVNANGLNFHDYFEITLQPIDLDTFNERNKMVYSPHTTIIDMKSHPHLVT